VLGNGIGEGATEAVQEVIEDVAASWGTETEVEWGPLIDQSIEAAAVGGLIGGVMGASGAVGSEIYDKRLARNELRLGRQVSRIVDTVRRHSPRDDEAPASQPELTGEELTTAVSLMVPTDIIEMARAGAPFLEEDVEGLAAHQVELRRGANESIRFIRRAIASGGIPADMQREQLERLGFDARPEGVDALSPEEVTQARAHPSISDALVNTAMLEVDADAQPRSRPFWLQPSHAASTHRRHRHVAHTPSGIHQAHDHTGPDSPAMRVGSSVDSRPTPGYRLCHIHRLRNPVRSASNPSWLLRYEPCPGQQPSFRSLVHPHAA